VRLDWIRAPCDLQAAGFSGAGTEFYLAGFGGVVARARTAAPARQLERTQTLNPMKTPTLLAVGFLAVVPLSLFADANTDRTIEDSLKSSYNFRRVLEKERVDVKVRDGVVTLTGAVADEEHRRLAEDTAANLQGVTRVENQLRIESTHREGSDDWIAAKVRSKLLFKANVKLKDIDVLVRDGVVTLTGRADSGAQKDLTEAYVREIAGVRDVRNELQVVDKAVRNEFERRERDDRVNRDVAPGAEARVARERDELRVDRARAEAKIEQERAEVRRERAEAQRDIEQERERARERSNRLEDRDLGDKIDDGSVTAQIKSELFANRSTSGLKTKIDTHNGHVLITGEASSDAEKDLITRIARNVRGVMSVNNRMTVKH
jgi:osmotically-inducible protein OsmY